MVEAYIAGAKVLVADRIAYATANGLSARVGATYRLPAAPWRKVWHTMEAPEDDPGTVPDEGWELDQIVGYVTRHRTPPHLWALPLHDVVLQTVPLTKSAYALRHDDPAGVNETNHAHAIQTEVIGYARDGLDDPDLCDWLGRRVLGPIVAAGVPVTPFVVAPSTGADGYGLDGKVRMSWGQWASFGGQCGHANVPGQLHWDPGVADYLRIARAANHAPQPEDDDMPHVLVAKGQPIRLVVGGRAILFPNPEYAAAARAAYKAKFGEKVVDFGTNVAAFRYVVNLLDPTPDVDVNVAALAAALTVELGGSVDATVVEAAVRRVLDATRLTTG